MWADKLSLLSILTDYGNYLSAERICYVHSVVRWFTFDLKSNRH